MTPAPRTLSTGTFLRVLAPALVGVLLAAWLAAAANDRIRDRVDADVRAAGALALPGVSTAVRDQLASSTTAPGTTYPVERVSEAGVSEDAVVEARDSGSPRLDDTGGRASIVVPVYGEGAAPTTTAARRAQVSAYKVVPLSLQAALTAAAPDEGGLAVLGPSSRVAAVPSAATSGSRVFVVQLDAASATGWRLEAWERVPSMPATTALVVVGVVLLFGAVSALLMVEERRTREALERQDQLEADGALVSGLAPVVQASLDLGEVIPAASAHLAQGLGLAGLSLAVPSGAGERQLFAQGELPNPDVPPVAAPPPGLEPGETFALSLARGGRVLGVLRVVAGRPLAPSELRALATASELLGSTLANAEAFAQQQVLVERMQTVDELKTVFLATASHELRTPVAAIVGFSTLVLDMWGRDDSEQTRAFLERVLANAKSLEALTEQLLDFSRLERGLKPGTGELLDLGDTTTRVLAEQPELSADHRLLVHAADDCLVHGSAAAIARIVTNLVSNAAKYSPVGTAITVTVRSDGEQVSLVVDDEGPGIPPAERERVFSRFYRGSGDSVAGTRGTGVGLAIVAEFAASMSGTTTVGVSPAGGSRFCVTFPAAEPQSHLHDERDAHVRLS